tara:strand:- start:3507 stop:4049 length:543 start_codon:yes stop_codon:yes gene_type:complete
MSGWLYVIKNGDLYKIGITKNFEIRMRQLKPDNVVVKVYSSDFKELEREFHKRYKNVRIPQTEYFRLDHKHIREIKKRISLFYYPKSISYLIFINTFTFLLVLFLFVSFISYLTINNISSVVLITFHWMEKISLYLSFLSMLIKSDKYFSLFNELKFRLSRSFVFLIFAFSFRITILFFL